MYLVFIYLKYIDINNLFKARALEIKKNGSSNIYESPNYNRLVSIIGNVLVCKT
jgi:hypothetical protein